ncbi:uncharacterized protein [Taeniopygia guttata]|uniref:uncharacterized protein n=1 Tax=Taeniopygia guttata TaxID=59729 RepID=UPI003BB8DFC4
MPLKKCRTNQSTLQSKNSVLNPKTVQVQFTQTLSGTWGRHRDNRGWMLAKAGPSPEHLPDTHPQARGGHGSPEETRGKGRGTPRKAAPGVAGTKEPGAAEAQGPAGPQAGRGRRWRGRRAGSPAARSSSGGGAAAATGRNCTGPRRLGALRPRGRCRCPERGTARARPAPRRAQTFSLRPRAAPSPRGGRSGSRRGQWRRAPQPHGQCAAAGGGTAGSPGRGERPGSAGSAARTPETPRPRRRSRPRRRPAHRAAWLRLLLARETGTGRRSPPASPAPRALSRAGAGSGRLAGLLAGGAGTGGSPDLLSTPRRSCQARKHPGIPEDGAGRPPGPASLRPPARPGARCPPGRPRSVPAGPGGPGLPCAALCGDSQLLWKITGPVRAVRQGVPVPACSCPGAQRGPGTALREAPLARRRSRRAGSGRSTGRGLWSRDWPRCSEQRCSKAWALPDLKTQHARLAHFVFELSICETFDVNWVHQLDVTQTPFLLYWEK